jgi:uncharacterized protein (TIGR00251 family)
MSAQQNNKSREAIIEITVIPRSSRNEITEVKEGRLKAKLTASPVDGAANKQLIALLSETYGVSKRNIVILRGESSRRKTVKIVGVAL